MIKPLRDDPAEMRLRCLELVVGSNKIAAYSAEDFVREARVLYAYLNENENQEDGEPCEPTSSS